MAYATFDDVHPAACALSTLNWFPLRDVQCADLSMYMITRCFVLKCDALYFCILESLHAFMCEMDTCNFFTVKLDLGFPRNFLHVMDSCNCSTVKLELGFPRNFLHVMIRNLSSIWLWCFFVAIPTVFARSCAIVTRSNIHMGNSLILGRSEKVLLS